MSIDMTQRAVCLRAFIGVVIIVMSSCGGSRFTTQRPPADGSMGGWARRRRVDRLFQWIRRPERLPDIY
jgi:hypothetical protein